MENSISRRERRIKAENSVIYLTEMKQSELAKMKYFLPGSQISVYQISFFKQPAIVSSINKDWQGFLASSALVQDFRISIENLILLPFSEICLPRTAEHFMH